MPLATEIAANVSRVRQQMAEAAVRSGRDPASVRLVAVTKTFPAETLQAGYECGLRDFGENRVQEFCEKLPTLRTPDAVFHLIGHLQSNKVRPATAFDWIETVDSERLARRLSQAAMEVGKTLSVLIEVKLGEEETKAGISEAGLPELVASIAALPNLALRGLMGMPAFFEDPEKARPHFRRLRELRDNIQKSGFPDLRELSMGMTRDFHIAIEEGATIVRIGTALFGPRSARRAVIGE
jgi:pyridoxal phosphate enzyme (YggS family)